MHDFRSHKSFDQGMCSMSISEQVKTLNKSPLSKSKSGQLRKVNHLLRRQKSAHTLKKDKKCRTPSRQISISKVSSISAVETISDSALG